VTNAERVLDVLEERGWYQGGLRSHIGVKDSVCVVGAIIIAFCGTLEQYGENDWPTTEGPRFLEALCTVVKRETRNPYALVPTYNDNLRTTLEDIKLRVKEAGVLIDEGLA
jgi:hypothetical protein